MAATVGMMRKDGVSDYLKIFIKQDDVTVIGYIGQGASKQLSSFWQNPFEGDTVGQAGGGATSKIADVGQVTFGSTSKTVLNSALVWEGISPHEITVPVVFQAYQNAKTEVNDAIMYLEQFASPDLDNTIGFGAIPKVCSVNVGRRLILPDCQIKDVSYELDQPKTKDGYYTNNTVTLQISMNNMSNRSEIPNLYK